MIFWRRQQPLSLKIWGKREEVTGRDTTRLLPQLNHSNTTMEFRVMEWSCELLNRVKTLWDQGLTATEIGEVVNKSRNAIIGKLSRARKQGAKVQTRTTAPKVKKVKKMKSVAPAVPRGATDGSGKQRTVPPITVASPPPTLEPITEFNGWQGIVAEIACLQSRQCRFPLGDPVISFCRAPLDDLRYSYCEYHAEIVRQKNGKRAGE
jgi:hypothetical protein